MDISDEGVLFAKWLRDPLRIGAVVPSGAALAHAMAKAVDNARPGIVVELGGGTGAVTRALLKSGIAPADLVIIERDEGLYRLLVQRFPGTHVILGDAMHVKDLVRRAGLSPVKAIVSGLPLLAMAPRSQMILLRQCFALMGGDGLVVQFTYGPASPVPERRLKRFGLKAKLAKRVWRNVPPATVWRFTRADASDLAPRKRRTGFLGRRDRAGVPSVTV